MNEEWYIVRRGPDTERPTVKKKSRVPERYGADGLTAVQRAARVTFIDLGGGRRDVCAPPGREAWARLQSQLDATAECAGCVDSDRRTPHLNECPNHRSNW